MRARPSIWGVELTLPNVLCLLAIMLMPLSWIPVFRAPRTTIEVQTVVYLLLAVGLLPALMLYGRPKARLTIFLLMIAWAFVFWLSLYRTGTLGEGGIIFQKTLVPALGGCTLAIMLYHSTLTCRQIGTCGSLALTGAVLFSALLANISIANLFTGRLLTDRWWLLSTIIKPMFNSFLGRAEAGEYAASELNSLAAAFVTFGALAFAREKRNDEISPFPLIVASASFVICFLLFSTASFILLVLFVFLKVFQVATTYKPMTRFLVLTATGVLSAIALQYVLSYSETNLAGDATSRAIRESQYRYAFDIVSREGILGIGYFEVYGLPVHNLPLFSWATGGLVLLGLALAQYFILARQTAKLCLRDSLNYPIYIFLGSVVALRTLVGGGGGVPIAPTIVALALLATMSVERGAMRIPSRQRTARYARRSPPNGVLNPLARQDGGAAQR